MSDDLERLERIAKVVQGPLFDCDVERHYHADVHAESFYDERVGDFILAFSPDVCLRLITRVRELEKRCRIVESHPADFAIEGEPLPTQVFVLKERLMDERHKTYQLEHEVAELEKELAEIEHECTDAQLNRLAEDR